MRQFVRDILEMGHNRYEFIKRARYPLWALLCQGMLNDPKLELRAEQWGTTLTAESDYVDWLSTIAKTRVRYILKDLIENKQFATKVAEGNFNFLRTHSAYKRAMEFAYRRFKWLERGLE